jgi:hypothetical protein
VPKSGENKFPLLDSFPFDPAQYSPAMGSFPQDTTKIRAVMHCSLQGLTKPALKFSASLIEKSSQQSFSLPVSIISAKKEGELGTLLVELRMPELEPGEYLLAIAAEDTASQARSQTSISCRIY